MSEAEKTHEHCLCRSGLYSAFCCVPGCHYEVCKDRPCCYCAGAGGANCCRCKQPKPVDTRNYSQKEATA